MHVLMSHHFPTSREKKDLRSSYYIVVNYCRSIVAEWYVTSGLSLR